MARATVTGAVQEIPLDDRGPLPTGRPTTSTFYDDAGFEAIKLTRIAHADEGSE
jgi:hypothetical protein